MNKKLVNAICTAIIIVGGGICSIGYIVGSSTFPWWLILFGAIIICGIFRMAVGIKEETDKEKKRKKLIGCICESISMISVLIFLILMFCTKFEYSWLVVFIGGMASGIIYMISDAAKKSE